jgi:hypothetical protein
VADCPSRITFLTGRYAVIELECLAVAWIIKNVTSFSLACPSKVITVKFTMITDHNPLIPILSTHRLDEIGNPRLQRLRTLMMSYNFTAQWLKGTSNQAADALSRHPHQPATDGDDPAEYEVTMSAAPMSTTCQALTSGSDTRMRASAPQPDNLRLQELQDHSSKDQEYQDLKEVGFPPNQGSLPQPLQKFWSVKDNLTINDGLIVYGCRLLIPKSL